MPDPTTQMNGRQTIFASTVAIIQDMTSDWDTDIESGIGPDTRLIADLGFESIDVVQLVVAVEERFQRRDLPFEELLMEDGQYVDDLRVGDLAEFLGKHLARS